MLCRRDYGLLGEFMDGGTASGALPQSGLGLGPILSTSLAPSLMSAWLNQGLVQGLPLSVAGWMYMFRFELLLATISTPSALTMRMKWS